MNISIEEIRRLREALDENRMRHEALITKAQVLREHCEEIKEMYGQTSEEMLAIIKSAKG